MTEPPRVGTSTTGRILVGTKLQPVAVHDVKLRFSGNLVLNDEVYRAVLERSAPPDDFGMTSSHVQRTLQDFLILAGYELAEVVAQKVGDVIEVFIDEGQLDKIIFPRLGAYRNIRLRLELNLPYNVFNRPYIERRIQEMAEDQGYTHAEYELVRVADVAHIGIQLPDVGQIAGFELIPEPRPYELHLFFERHPWNRGLSLDLALRSPDGLVTGIKFRGSDLIVIEDRWLTRANVSMRVQDVLSSEATSRFLSGAGAELQYFTQPLPYTGLRPQLWLRGRYISRQRIDLELENYDVFILDPALTLSAAVGPELRLGMGAGLDFRFLLPLPDNASLPPRVNPQETLRGFVNGRAELVFDWDNPRRDRRHELDVEVRHYIPFSQEFETSFTRLSAEYQKVFNLGYDEFRVESEAFASFGYVSFIDEARVADYVLGRQDNTVFTRAVASGRAEYRLSLVRDLYKVGIVGDFAAYSYRETPTSNPRGRVAGSAGAGFHALLLASFQLDVYVAVGFISADEPDIAISLSLAQAF